MRHRVAGYKLGRDTEHRRALWRNMAIALFTHGQITTTVTKAKSVQPFVEKLITAARKGDLASRRKVLKAIGNPILVDRDLKDFKRKELRSEGYVVNKYHELQRGPRVVAKLFDEIASDYTDREGGYTRIVKLANRRIGDATQLCVLQLVGDEEGPQVSGSYSRRRDKANRRMEFAAKLRKQKSGSKDQAKPESEQEAEAEAAAQAEVEAESPAQPEAGQAEAAQPDAGPSEASAPDEQAKPE